MQAIGQLDADAQQLRIGPVAFDMPLLLGGEEMGDGGKIILLVILKEDFAVEQVTYPGDIGGRGRRRAGRQGEQTEADGAEASAQARRTPGVRHTRLPCHSHSLTENSGCCFFSRSTILSSMYFGPIPFLKVRSAPRR